MMGRLNRDQTQLFYEFCLDEVAPDDHLAREISSILDLSWVHAELAPYSSLIGRPSIDPVLMIRMLIVGCVFAIRPDGITSRGRWLLQSGDRQGKTVRAHARSCFERQSSDHRPGGLSR